MEDGALLATDTSRVWGSFLIFLFSWKHRRDYDSRLTSPPPIGGLFLDLDVLRLRPTPLSLTGPGGEVIQPEEIPKDATTGIPRVPPSHPAIVGWRAMTVVLLCVLSLSLIFLHLRCIRRPPSTRFKRCAYSLFERTTRRDAHAVCLALRVLRVSVSHRIAAASPPFSFLPPFHYPLPSFSCSSSSFSCDSLADTPPETPSSSPSAPPSPHPRPHTHADARERHLDRGPGDRGAAVPRARRE
jgi:hypothetical protein